MTALPETSRIGPWPRFGARFVDGLVLLIPVLILTVPIAGGFQIGSNNRGGKQILASALGVLLAYGYFVLMEANRGSTIGKGAFKIEISSGGGKPTLDQAARRNAWMLLSVIPGGLGGILAFAVAIAIGVSIGRDPAGRGFHDRFAGVDVTRRI